MTPDFWRGRRVFITGHTGFKGSWLSLWLHALRAHVTGYALAPVTQPSLFEETRLADHITSIHGDILDRASLENAMREAKPEIIIHMAAQSLVRASYRSPIDTFQTNVMGTANLLEAVRNIKNIKAVICVTSDKCYENDERNRPFRETDPMGGRDPYSSSKGCAELLTASYRHSFFNPETYQQHGVAIATARSGNVIGGGDFAEDRLIPDLIAACREKRKALIRNPNSIRPWQHVLDPLNGYLMLAEKLVQSGQEFSDAWNFGPELENAKSVAEIANAICAMWGHDASWQLDHAPHPHEAATLKLDISKAKAKLGFTPKLDLSTALRSIVEWEQHRLSGSAMWNVTLDQIETFQTLI